MRFVLLSLALATVLALSACGSPRRSEPIVGPIPLDARLERGRKAFDEHCYKCHLQGEGGMAPILNDKPLPKFLMRLQTRIGLGAMPAIPKEHLSDEDLDALLDYVVALRRAGR